MSVKCPKCDSDNPDTQSFCGDCGTQLIPSKEIPAHTKTLETPFPQLSPGISLANRYEILKELGKGGMGEVYLAEDTNLKRKVAIKVLPQPFVLDEERLARFEREARLLASLNHPNVATIYGLEKSDGQQFLVMELVEGDTLAERIKKGALPVEEALEVCRQIAEGLESAHDKGIIHRDLKPGNIKITPQGNIKILDFGLAKAFLDQSDISDLSKSRDITEEMTQPGMILGTAAYMSPEQTKAIAVDKKSDIWAFGCILYECLTGKRAFPGETISETLAAILKDEPKWDALPLATPQSVKRLLKRALQKDPRIRLHDIADARLEMYEDAVQTADEVTTKRHFSLGLILALCSAMIILGILVGPSFMRLFKPEPHSPPVKSIVRVEPGFSLDGWRRIQNFNWPSRTAMAISRDGNFIVYSAVKDDAGADERPKIFLRRLDQLAADPIPGTEGGINPFLSPDDKWIGFWADEKLWKLPIEGGVPQYLCNVTRVLGASWGEDNTIVFGGYGSGLVRVSSEGGESEVLTNPDPERNESGHRLPFHIPKGKGLLFSTTRGGAWDNEPRVAFLNNSTGEWQVLLDNASDACYVPTGHIVFLREGTLMAATFDPDYPDKIGPPFRMVPNIIHSLNAVGGWYNSGDGQYSISDSGSLIYAPGGMIPDRMNSLVWVDYKGNEESIGTVTDAFIAPRLSPDGRKIVYATIGRARCIKIYDIDRDMTTGIVLEGFGTFPLWTPDSSKIIFGWFGSNPPFNICSQRIDGTGKRETLTNSKNEQRPGSLSPDGNYLAFMEANEGGDIFILNLKDKSITPFVSTEYRETHAEFSPDGHWMAYRSDESGRDEVYIRAVNGSGIWWKVSHEGGREPLWSRRGDQLYYRNGNKWWVVDVQTDSGFSPKTPRLLFEKAGYSLASPSHGYDISLDGKRFLVVKEEERESRAITEMVLIQNWFEELKKKVPAIK